MRYGEQLMRILCGVSVIPGSFLLSGYESAEETAYMSRFASCMSAQVDLMYPNGTAEEKNAELAKYKKGMQENMNSVRKQFPSDCLMYYNQYLSCMKNQKCPVVIGQEQGCGQEQFRGNLCIQTVNALDQNIRMAMQSSYQFMMGGYGNPIDLNMLNMQRQVAIMQFHAQMQVHAAEAMASSYGFVPTVEGVYMPANNVPSALPPIGSSGMGSVGIADGSTKFERRQKCNFYKDLYDSYARMETDAFIEREKSYAEGNVVMGGSWRKSENEHRRAKEKYRKEAAKYNCAEFGIFFN